MRLLIVVFTQFLPNPFSLEFTRCNLNLEEDLCEKNMNLSCLVCFALAR